jgi:hypothetical protein
VQNFTQLGGCADFYVLLFESCNWPDSTSQWIRQRVCITFCTNIGKGVTETLPMIRQAFGEESLNRTRVFEWLARFKADRNRRHR